MEKHHARPVSEAATQEGQEGDARLAGCDDRVLWPGLGRASKVAVSILAYEDAEPEMRAWQLEAGDVRSDPAIAAEILSLSRRGALSVVMTMACWAALTRKVLATRAKLPGLRVLARARPVYWRGNTVAGGATLVY